MVLKSNFLFTFTHEWYIMTHVVHCRKNSYDVYIGRPSKWGNPYEIGIDGTRSEVIAKYKEYLLNNTELLDSLCELEGKTLGCWCVPHDCHGRILVELVKERQLQSRNLLLFDF